MDGLGAGGRGMCRRKCALRRSRRVYNARCPFLVRHETLLGRWWKLRARFELVVEGEPEFVVLRLLERVGIGDERAVVWLLLTARVGVESSL